LKNCVLRGNRSQVTGSAIDVLEGSAARIVNCLLVSNVSNMGFDVVAKVQRRHSVYQLGRGDRLLEFARRISELHLHRESKRGG